VLQWGIVGIIVIAAAAWVVWSNLIPRKTKQAVRARLKGGKAR
jgi:hypothetical protein